MPFDPLIVVAHDDLAVTGKRDRFDDQPGLLLDLPPQRFGQRFAALDNASRQGVNPVGWRIGPPHDQHFAVANDRGADGQKRSVWISSVRHLFGHGNGTVEVA